jgi:hypothetical protein
MNYSEVLTRAWQIIWKHKVLWIFGIFAGCASSGGSGGGGGNYNFSNNTQELPESVQRFVENVPTEAWVAIMVGILCLVLFLVVIGVFLSTIGKIGVVRGAVEADQDIESHLTFGGLFKGSLPYFWRVFLLNLLVGIVIFLVVAAGILVAIFGTVLTFGLGLFCLLPLICLLIPVGIIIGVVIDQSAIAIITENLGIFEGLQRGWEVVRSNLGSIALIWLILDLGIRLIGGLILSVPLLLFMTPLIVAAISGSDQAFGVGAIISAICVIGYLPFLIVLSGMLNSYVQSGWTLTFLRLTHPPVVPSEPLPEPTI